MRETCEFGASTVHSSPPLTFTPFPCIQCTGHLSCCTRHSHPTPTTHIPPPPPYPHPHPTTCLQLRETFELLHPPLTLHHYPPPRPHPLAAVRETFEFAAAIRLPSSVSPAAKAALVDEVLIELGLRQVEGTYIGVGG